MSELPEIPPHIRVEILPSPLLSVSQFLRFPFPAQLPTLSKSYGIQPDKTNYLVQSLPNIQDISIETLKDLPIPSSPILKSLKDTFLSATDLFSSVVYAHLPTHTSYYPLWILTYWITVSQLREHIKSPWMNVELYLSSNGSRWCSSEYRKLCQSAQNVLLYLLWSGNVYGFPDTLVPTLFLALYPSSNWLATSHIDQQLLLLRQSLMRSGIHNYEVLGPDFFNLVQNMYDARNSVPYIPGSSRYLSGVGDDVLNGNRQVLCGVGNVNNNHWVALVIDIEQQGIYYGDSLRGNETRLKNAIQWWIEAHTHLKLEIRDLDIASQSDGFNCGIYALNTIEHLIFPKENPLLTSESIALSQDRLSRFIKTCEQDSQMVCCLFLNFRHILSNLSLFFKRTDLIVNDNEILVFKERKAYGHIVYDPEIVHQVNPVNTSPPPSLASTLSPPSPPCLTVLQTENKLAPVTPAQSPAITSGPTQINTLK